MVSLETYTVKVDSQGRFLIPLKLRKEAGIEPGNDVLAFVENGGLVILSREAALEQAQQIAEEALRGHAGSLVDELLEERLLEVKREAKLGRKKSA